MITTIGVIFALAVLVTSRLPHVGKYVRLLNTMVHETGHALVALLTGGRVQRIDLFSNTGGLATTLHRGTLSSVLTTLAGYPFASAFSVLCVWLVKVYPPAVVGLILMAFLAINAIFWVRNFMGWIWVILVLGILSTVIWVYPSAFSYVSLAIAIILWVDSLGSALYITYLSITNPRNAGDTSILAKATWIPALVWGVVFGSFAVTCFYQCVLLWLDKGWLWDMGYIRLWGR